MTRLDHRAVYTMLSLAALGLGIRTKHQNQSNSNACRQRERKGAVDLSVPLRQDMRANYAAPHLKLLVFCIPQVFRAAGIRAFVHIDLKLFMQLRFAVQYGQRQT